jgi:hypothetical protein
MAWALLEGILGSSGGPALYHSHTIVAILVVGDCPGWSREAFAKEGFARANLLYTASA